MMKETMDFKEWIFLMILSVVWGGSFFFAEIALTALPPLTIVFLRVFLGALILLLFSKFLGLKLPRIKKIWFYLLVMGLINNVIPFCSIVWGQKFITGGLASLINASTPFSTIIAAHFLTGDEKITLSKLVGIITGFSGVFILIGFEVMNGDGSSVSGMLAVLCATVSYAFAGIWGRRFKTLGIEPVVTATGQLICASAILLPVAALVDTPWLLEMPGVEVWGAVFGAALLSTSLAYILYFKILASSGATNVLLVTFLIPVSAIVLGVLFLGEIVQLRHFLGMGIIGTGLIIIDGRLLNRIFRKRKSTP